MSNTLATALVEAQKEMPPVDKTGKSNFGTHATLDHIIAKTRGVLNKHGLSITQLPVMTEMGGPGLRTTITHVSGESASEVMPLLLVKQDMQSLGSAITYARRYAWAAALGISAEADDDGEQATRPKASEGDPKAAPKAAVSQADNATPPPASDEPASPSGTPFAPPPTVQAELDRKQASSVPNQDGGVPEEVAITFGKHKGKLIRDLVESETGYLTWLAGDSFEPKTKEQRRAKAAAQTVLGVDLTFHGDAPVDDSIPF